MSRTYRRNYWFFDDSDFNHFTMRWRKENGYKDKTKNFHWFYLRKEINIKSFPLESQYGKSFRDGSQRMNKKFYKLFLNRKFRHSSKQKMKNGDYENNVLKKDVEYEML